MLVILLLGVIIADIWFLKEEKNGGLMAGFDHDTVSECLTKPVSIRFRSRYQCQRPSPSLPTLLPVSSQT